MPWPSAPAAATCRCASGRCSCCCRFSSTSCKVCYRCLQPRRSAMKKWAFALLALGASSAFAADVAKGTFHFGPVKFEPVDAIAYQVEGRDGKPLTLIAFTDFKIDRQGVLDAINTDSALIGQINDNQKGSYVVVRLTAPNRCGLGGLVGDGAKQIDLGDNFAAKVSQG